MDRSEGERRGPWGPADQPKNGSPGEAQRSGFGWERTSKEAARSLPVGREERSGLCEDAGSRPSRSRRSMTGRRLKNLNEVQRELDKVYKLLMNIPVTGDAVEYMAAAKEGLRKAYQMLERTGPAAKAGEDPGGKGGAA